MIILIIVLLFALASLTGCATDSEMKELFKDEKPRIFVDLETNKTFLVRHHLGDTYEVEKFTLPQKVK